ncbi:MAG: response regulator, partial [Fibromonadaceae bacterium]|nr:response regulator [Fibromonadaceae bacterium]
MKTIFVVDDNNTNLTKAKEVLGSHYRVLALPSAEKMFALFVKIKPDLILLDIDMPEMDGFVAIEKLKANESTAHIPIMFLTASTDVEMEAKGIKLGAIDFVKKPFSPPVLLNRIANHLHIDEMIRKRTEQIELHTEQIVRLQNGIVFTMANLVESRDKITGGHIERTSRYIKILMDAMMGKGLYLEEMIEWDLDMVVASARLHDVGKISVPDLILNKPDKLTQEEFAKIRLHTTEGEQIIDDMIDQTGQALFLYHAKLFAGYHHERWDGNGYPYGKKSEEIPLQGRIMAVADVYDALVSVRPYKKAFTCEEAEAIIQKDSGTF